MRRAWLILAVAATVLELAATLSGLGAEPVAIVPGWGPTRAADGWAVLLTAVGCAALFDVRRVPTSALAISTGSYLVFILRDYEFGMTLPPMVAVFLLTTWGSRRLLAAAAALGCLAATLLWVAGRAGPLEEDGTASLVWVAFGAVASIFFLLPLLLGELVRMRRRLQDLTRSMPGG